MAAMSVTSSDHRGELYLIPNLLGETALDSSLPPVIATITASISHFVVEEEKSARRFIKLLCPDRVIRELSLQVLNEHTKPHEIDALTAPLLQGHNVGIISEAGCPAIADPGAELVRRAHELGIAVRPLVGPCSMTLALMASGFNGQRWRFVGYLPIEGGARKDTIRALEKDLYEHQETQIVMDTPYRNQKLFEELLTTCRPETRICIASALTTEQESIAVRSVHEWRETGFAVPKSPAIFLLGR
jgi:16S rRNA (cytidine1402-2'-O)-methyltransferase